MDDSIRKYLSDIIDSIVEIEEETCVRGRRFDVLCTDRVYRKFVERNIGIIGEAVNRVIKIMPNIQITAARSIVNTRNLIIHSYDSIDKEIIWAIVVRHLPLLKQEAQQLLDS